MWDCKDLKKTVVPDGDYFINIEHTDKNGEGVNIKIPITKGKSAMTAKPKDNPSFIDMAITFTPK